MLAVEDEIAKLDWGKAGPPAIHYHGQPADESKPSLLWDGEWEVTYVTFRDMGAAFGVAILGIYLLVVAQFGSYRLPLVILTPVPLTLIGIVLGHWMLGASFTATSMIGFIALAGIIVRNSILLVDFIQRRRQEGADLRDALLEAGAIRFKPIFLTAAAAMIGAAFILTDPIFQGLALAHQSLAKVRYGTRVADGDGTIEFIAGLWFAIDSPARDERLELRLRRTAAVPRLAVGTGAGLVKLRRIDTVKPNLGVLGF
jgi:hypothetical protein